MPFRPVRPAIGLWPANQKDDEWDAKEFEGSAKYLFMAPVPLEFKTEIGKFHARQWHTMALFARCTGALDLVRSTPALAFALASNWVFRRPAPTQPMRTARRLVRLPQATICDWLGFPPTPSTIRILRKLHGRDISIEALLYLRDGLKDDGIAKRLRHCRTITRRVILAATIPSCRHHFSPKFLVNLADLEEANGREDRILIDHLYVLLRKSMRQYLRPNQHFDSLEQVRDFVRNYGGYDQPADRDFGPPPIPGTETIIPLTDTRQLTEESGEMDHCVANLYREAAEGRAYFYRLLFPERATISLIREGTIWRVDEIQGPRNRPVAPETQQIIQGWIANYYASGDAN